MPDLCTLRAIAYAAYRLINVVEQAGRGYSASQLNDATEAYNTMVDGWSIDPLAVFRKSILRLDLTPAKQIYTIGIDPTGALTADFPVARPSRIDTANLITQAGTSVEVRVPMDILEPEEWARIRVQAVPTSIPRRLYNDYASPLSNLYLWGIPIAPAAMELYTWEAIPQVEDPTDVILLPPGYRRALTYNLAVELAPRFSKGQLSPIVLSTAIESKAAIEALNAPSPVLDCDPALLHGRRSNFNYLIGE